MIVKPDSRQVVRMVGDASDLTPTPAIDAPTAPDAPVPGAPLEPEATLPVERGDNEGEGDALTRLQRRVHPFA